MRPCARNGSIAVVYRLPRSLALYHCIDFYFGYVIGDSPDRSFEILRGLYQMSLLLRLNTQILEQTVRYQSSVPVPVTSCTVETGLLVCKAQRMHQRYISGSSSRCDNCVALLEDRSIGRLVGGDWIVSVGLGLLDPAFCYVRFSNTPDIT